MLGGAFLEKDICKFIPKKNDSESIDIINYVYETSVKKFSETISTYLLFNVTSDSLTLAK